MSRGAVARSTAARNRRFHAEQVALPVTATVDPGDDLAGLDVSDAVDEAADSDPRTELAGCLAPLVAGLPGGYREAMVLTEFDGLTQVAAAQRLGLSVSGMKSRVQRGRAMLRQQLTDCCQIEQDRRGAIIGFRPGSGSCGCRPGSS